MRVHCDAIMHCFDLSPNKKLNKSTKTQKATGIHQETKKTGAENRTHFKLGKYLNDNKVLQLNTT